VSVLKTALVAGVFAGSMLALSSPTQAATTAETMQHFIECANWMITDPAKHAQFCSPGHDVFVSGSTGYAAPEDNRCTTLFITQELECLTNCCN
jgi:hypothetical protein